MRRPIVKTLWVNGRASDHREEWMEELKAHCERCSDDKERNFGGAGGEDFGTNDAEETVWMLGVVAKSRLLSTGVFVPIGK